MFKKGNQSSNTYFRKGDMTHATKLIGNYHSPHQVYPMIRTGLF